MNYNFKTPHGLKVRLNPHFFMSLLTGENRMFSDDEMIDNTRMYDMVTCTEQRFALPTAVTFIILVILCFVENVTIATACACVLIPLVIFKLITFTNLSRIFTLILIPVEYILLSFGLIKILPILLAIFLKRYNILITYIIYWITDFIIDAIITDIVSKKTKSKYNYAFSDVEMIFFSEFYNFTNDENNLKLDELISVYVDVCCSD